ncbi:MAG: DUF4388 domain-containing protein [Myxococcales bacterium]|nr:DUF4388 domain-containing protein [Polyangiaceae bacterium]MDW8248486.1 DUF4388 domain-containing protein [Myxococcales bacterium]
MAKSRVVLATGDEWIANLIGAVLRDAGLEVILASSAEEALTTLQSTRVDAILADAALPDDATWLVTQLRQSPGSSAIVPFLLLAHTEDSFSRMEALRAGADVCLTKPFRADELCLQLLAILAMHQRLSSSFRSSGVISTRNVTLRTPPPPASPTAGLSGDLAVVSLATVLSLLELERRSGTMVVRGPKHVATLSMREGTAAKATLAGTPTSIIAVLRRMLRWKTGQFEFSPDEVNPASVPPNQHSIGALLIEAARLDDETPSSRRSDSILPPSGEYDKILQTDSIEPGPTPRVSLPPPSVRPPSRIAPRRPSFPPPVQAARVTPPKLTSRPASASTSRAPTQPTPFPSKNPPPSQSSLPKNGPPRPGPPRPGPPRPRGSGGS